MEAPSKWPDGFSISTQAALRFAWAAAAARHGHASPSSSTMLDLDDLLVGTLLAHPGTSGAEICFRHFGLVAGQVLDARYPRLSADGLNRRLDALTSTEMPACTPEALDVLNLAASRRNEQDKGEVHLSSLWYGILGTQNSPLTTRLMSAFETRGTNLAEVQRATEEWLDSGKSKPYASWLEERFPSPQAPTSVVNFKADTTDATRTASGDLLQIGREVDAFAYLLASKSTRPPLAIGLFGAWGSGKTFFMESVRRRIASLLAETAVDNQPQGRTPFWKKVISIEFNAWHYAEGDLLASLINQIFTVLQKKTNAQALDPTEAERKGWLHNLDKAVRALDDKRAELASAESKLSSLEADIEALTSKRDEAVRSLQDDVATSSLEKSLNAVATALQAATGRTELASGLTVAEARRQLEEARREGLRFLGFVRWLGGSTARSVLAIVALAAVPLLVGYLEELSKSAPLAIFSGGVTVAFEALAMCTAFVRQHMDSIDKAREQLDAEIEAIRGKLQEEIDAKDVELEQQRGEVISKQTDIDNLQSERDRLQVELDTPVGIRIRRFLDERLGSGEYRDRLGIPAIVREDLQRLTSYVLRQNNEVRNSQDSAPPPKYLFNRIILYIDDLDRCPDDKVIQVLQAVHLLLAFELFIVVVAVDSRWLSHALMSRYPALGEGADPTLIGGQARPRDYLEKIFQVPFFVRPLGDTGRKNIVRGLLGDHLRHEGATDGSEGTPATKRRIREPESQVLDSQISVRQPPAALATEAFSVTPAELEFVESLAPLLGGTPRAVKRFVNLFQLLRVLLVDSPTSGEVRDTELAAFLLAIGNTDPDFASRLMSQPPASLKELTLSPPPPNIAPVPQPVVDWLTTPDLRNSWLAVTGKQVGSLADIVQRFSFG